MGPKKAPKGEEGREAPAGGGANTHSLTKVFHRETEATPTTTKDTYSTFPAEVAHNRPSQSANPTT